MQNDKHRKSKFNSKPPETEKDVQLKRESLTIITNEINSLKSEIRNAYIGHRPLFDFEKRQCIKKINTSIVIKKARLDNSPNTFLELVDGFPNTLIDDYFRKDASLRNNTYLSRLISSENRKENELEVLKNLYFYYSQAMMLPLLYVLKDSKKFVSTEELISAYEERNNIRVIRKIDKRMNKVKNVTLSEINNEFDDRNNDWVEKLICKVLSDACKSFVDNNSLFIDGIRVLYFGERKNVQFVDIKRAERKPVKKYNEIFHIMQTNKSNAKFAIPSLKKGLAVQHSSHINTIKKLAPEMNRIYDAGGMVDYKNKSKHKNIGSFIRREDGLERKGRPNNENFSFSIRQDFKRRDM